MTQEELKLVLEALKWCHGGEPCGTAEAIAVVEKALAQRTDQNFCSRCGKRVGGIDSIHTCTPPMENT